MTAVVSGFSRTRAAVVSGFSQTRACSSTRDVGNCPPFSYEQQGLFESKRENVTDTRSAEIDVVNHVRKFLDQTHTHRVRVVAKSAGPMRVCPSCHHPCYIDRPPRTSTATRYDYHSVRSVRLQPDQI